MVDVADVEQVDRMFDSLAGQHGRLDILVNNTGIAGPTGGTAEKPVGLVYIALAGDSGTTVHRLNFPGERERVKNWCAAIALNMLRMRVLGLEWTGRFR